MKPTRSLATALGSALALTAVTASPATAASLRVTPASGLPASGATVSISGSGFNATGDNGVGIYLVFGPKRPNFHLDANAFGAAKWVHAGGGGSGPGQAALSKDGSFRTTLTVKAKYTDGNGVAVDCLTTPCYVITMAAHGSSDRSQDAFTRITFASAPKGTTSSEPGSPQSSGTATSPAPSKTTERTEKPEKPEAPAPASSSPGADPLTAQISSEEETAVKTVSSSDTAPAWPFWTAVAAVAALGFASRAFTRRRAARR